MILPYPLPDRNISLNPAFTHLKKGVHSEREQYIGEYIIPLNLPFDKLRAGSLRKGEEYLDSSFRWNGRMVKAKGGGRRRG
jgi:hypothetical protein